MLRIIIEDGRKKRRFVYPHIGRGGRDLMVIRVGGTRLSIHGVGTRISAYSAQLFHPWRVTDSLPSDLWPMVDDFSNVLFIRTPRSLLPILEEFVWELKKVKHIY